MNCKALSEKDYGASLMTRSTMAKNVALRCELIKQERRGELLCRARESQSAVVDRVFK